MTPIFVIIVIVALLDGPIYLWWWWTERSKRMRAEAALGHMPAHLLALENQGRERMRELVTWRRQHGGERSAPGVEEMLESAHMANVARARVEWAPDTE